MVNDNQEFDKAKRSANILAMVNVFIWALAIIAMIFMMQDAPMVKKIFPILGGGVAVGVTLIGVISRMGQGGRGTA